MTDRTPLALVAILVVATLAHSVWRYTTARSIADRWLTQHRYRVRSLRMGWFRLPRFAPKLFRNEGRAFEFRAEVDDLRLGGTGVVWLRVWTDWIGLSEREPEVSWERMPVRVDDGSRALEDTWAERQLELLQRIARGETTFRARARSVDDGGEFDELVEHILALSRRGLVTCNTPILDVRGNSQYAAVTGVALTASGERFLAERSGR
jgi:hypothetical protein